MRLWSTNRPKLSIKGSVPKRKFYHMVQTKQFNERRQQIIDEASRLMNVHGPAGLSSTEVAQNVGLTQNSLKHYFKTKNDLVHACFSQTLDRFESMVAQVADVEPPIARIHALFNILFDRMANLSGRGERRYLRLAGLRTAASPVSEQLRSRYDQIFRQVVGFFAAAGMSGPSVRAHLLLESILELWFLLPHHSPREIARIKGHMLEILVRGIDPSGHGKATFIPVTFPDPDPTRASFLRAGINLINLKGYRGASVDQISSELGYTKGGFYHYLGSKDDLFVLCADRSFDIIDEVINESERDGMPGLDRALSVLFCLLELKISGKEPLLKTSAVFTLPELIRPRVLARQAEVERRIYGLFVQGVIDRSIHPLDPNIASHIYLAFLNAADGISGELVSHDASSIIAECLDALRCGILPALSDELEGCPARAS